MSPGGHGTKRGSSEARRSGISGIPKMELGTRRRPKTGPGEAQLSYFQTLGSVIEAFGEFAILADSDRTVTAIWAARKRSGRLSAESLIGRPIDSILDCNLFADIEALAGRTAALDRRQEVECAVRLRGAQRWFSVCAIPLEERRAFRGAIYIGARDVTHRVEAAHALAEREALLAQAEEIANFGSWELNLKTNQVKLSPQLLKIYELASGEDWSPKTYWNRMHPADRARARQIIDKGLAEKKPIRYVSRYRSPDGRTRIHLAHSVPLFDEHGKPERAIGVIQDITEQAHANQELRRLSQQILNEQDNQRRHLARELHESAGQSLAALKMTLGRLREALAENAHRTASLLESAAALADGAAREVRTVSYLLHPPMLDDAGLGPALRWYARGFTERSGISATVEIADPFPRYSQEIETTVFRVVQEALTNVHRYSGSTSAEIVLSRDDSQLRIEVRDHGCGILRFSGAAYRRAELGVGISGMRERVEQIGGIFELESASGEGTVVRAVLPSGRLPSQRIERSLKPMLRRRKNASQI